MERPSLLGELQRPPATLEQTQAKTGLKLCDPAGQGRLRPPSRAGSSADPSMPGDQVEVRESEQIHMFHQ